MPTAKQNLVAALSSYGPSFLGLGNTSAGIDDYSGHALSSTFTGTTTSDGGKTLTLTDGGSVLTVPGLTLSRTAATIAVLIRCNDSTGPSVIASPTNTPTDYISQLNGQSTPAVYIASAGTLLPSQTANQLPNAPLAEWVVVMFSASPSQTLCRCNGNEGSAPAAAAGSYTGWSFFQYGSYFMGGQVRAVATFPTALVSADMGIVENALLAYGGNPATGRLLAVEGDSISHSVLLDHVDQHAYWAVANAATGNAYTLRSRAVAGAIWANLTARSSQLTALATGAGTPTLLVMCGTNEVVYGGDNARIDGFSTAGKTYLAQRKSEGWRVIYLTMLPRATDDTARQRYNQSFLSDFTGATTTARVYRPATGVTYADFLVDVGSDPTIGVSGAQNNTAYYSDAVHPTVAAHAIMGNYVAAALALFPAPSQISSAATATATVGQAFSFQIIATNSPTSFGATGLPAGLSINAATGLISGTPQ